MTDMRSMWAVFAALLLGSMAARAAEPGTIIVEGEALVDSAKATEDPPICQDMTGFGRSWSGDAQLFWDPSHPGARLSLALYATAAADYAVAAVFTKAPDYATVQVHANGAKLGAPFKGYHAEVVLSEPVPLGTVALRAGANLFEIEILGKAPRSTGYAFGLDRLEFRPTRPLEPTATVGVESVPVLPPIQRAFKTVRPHEATIQPAQLSPLGAPKVDLRPQIESYGLKIRAQGDRGTCSVFAMAFLLEFMYNKEKGIHFHELSVEYLNCVTNLAAKNDSDGDFFSNIELGYRAYGVIPEVLMPYRKTYNPHLAVPPHDFAVGKKWPKFAVDFIKANDGKKGATEPQLKRVTAHLDAGIPVAGGFMWPSKGNFKTAVVEGVDLMVVPQGPSKVEDGHSIALVGYGRGPSFPGGGYFIFRNCWGPGFGDKGYGYMPFEYVLKYVNDLVAYKP